MQGAICAALTASTALSAALMGACDDNEKARSAQQQPAPPAATATVEQVDDNPLRFLGKQVTLSGEVDEVFDPRAFELEGKGIWWDDQILVLTRSPVIIGAKGLDAPGMLNDDDKVLVTGTVRRMNAADIERDLGWALESDVERKFANKPVLIADSIRVLEEREVWSEVEHPKGAIVGIYRIVTTPDINQLVGQSVTISRVPVRQKTERVMWIGYNDLSQILVVPSDTAALGGIEEGEHVNVSGTLDKMPAVKEAMQNWSLPKAMQARLGQEAVYINATRLEEAKAQDKMSMNTTNPGNSR